MWFLTISFVLLLLIGTPIAYVLGLSSVIYMFSGGNLNLFSSTPQMMISGVQQYGILAIPLFVLAGELMNMGGITSRLVRFANVLIGHVRGGLAYVNVMTNMFLASILGSPVAQTAMMSKVLVPEMEKQGYSKDFSSALTVSSALMAPLIPPSIPFLIYGVVANASVAKLFLGGVIPGILLGISFIVLIYILSLKNQFPKSERSPFAAICKSFLTVLPALMVPVVILAGILSGVFTATEASAVAVFIAFFVGKFLYRELKMKDIPKALIRTAIDSATVIFILSTSAIFGWVLTLEKIPHIVAEAISSISDSTFVFLLLVNIFLFVIGTALETLPAIIITVPVLLPAAAQYGIDPIHFGIVVCLNLIIGLITPPVGAVMFIASSVSQIRIEALIRALVPFLIAAIVVLFIVTYVPQTTVWLPGFL